MRKLFTILVMSLVLVIGLWGYSQSENRPAPSPDIPGGLTPNSDHPWGGDNGTGGGNGGNSGGTTGVGLKSKVTTTKISTGNFGVDLVLNHLSLHGSFLRSILFGERQITPIKTTVTTGSTNATPANPTTGNSAN